MAKRVFKIGITLLKIRVFCKIREKEENRVKCGKCCKSDSIAVDYSMLNTGFHSDLKCPLKRSLFFAKPSIFETKTKTDVMFTIALSVAIML